MKEICNRNRSRGKFNTFCFRAWDDIKNIFFPFLYYLKIFPQDFRDIVTRRPFVHLWRAEGDLVSTWWVGFNQKNTKNALGSVPIYELNGYQDLFTCKFIMELTGHLMQKLPERISMVKTVNNMQTMQRQYDKLRGWGRD